LESNSLIEWHDLVGGRFVAKVNRFAAVVEVSGIEHYVHVPNPTPAAELLKLGADVLLIKAPPHRKTEYRLLAARTGSLWATLDTSIPNRVFREGIRHSLLKEFVGRTVKKENVRLGKSIIDFQLSGRKTTYVEVKSCTMVVDGTALFPDAVTERGSRHLRELEAAVAGGAQAFMVWVIQRPDAERLKPYQMRDPKFAAELVRARDVGVGLLAYRCSFDTHNLRLVGQVPVITEWLRLCAPRSQPLQRTG
jgi:sugar fermentation stimulation protein A